MRFSGFPVSGAVMTGAFSGDWISVEVAVWAIGSVWKLIVLTTETSTRYMLYWLRIQ